MISPELSPVDIVDGASSFSPGEWPFVPYEIAWQSISDARSHPYTDLAVAEPSSDLFQINGFDKEVGAVSMSQVCDGHLYLGGDTYPPICYVQRPQTEASNWDKMRNVIIAATVVAGEVV